jgi:stage II sporulation protein D
MIRTCQSCPANRINGPLNISASESHVVAGVISSPRLLLSGLLRIAGDSFPPFEIANQLQIECRDGHLLLTLSMGLEEYVATVLQGESASLRSDEALKAMAVAARTYAVRFGSRHQLEGFDFCDTTHCQDLRLGQEAPRVQIAVAATEGELLWFEGRPAATYYGRSCGGELEDAHALEPNLRVPYLKRHHDEYCVRVPDEWHVQISKADLARALGQPVNAVTVGIRSDSGRVQRLLLDRRAMSATEFRLKVGRKLGWDKLRSDLYQLQDLGDRIAFRGRGQGHGVGLCQYGADIMGHEGRTYREILAFYYPGAKLGLNAQGLSWEKMPGESLDLITTNRNDVAILLPAAERALRFAIERTGWNLAVRPQVKAYPTTAIYRDATGEPGWVAGSTRGSVIRLQPLATLQRTRSLESTLRHEFVHLLMELHARPNAPLWLREGLTIFLCDPDSTKPAKIDVAALGRRLHSLRTEREMREAYKASASAVAEAVKKHGLNTVLSWVQ